MRPRGFSIVELLVVVAIVGLLAGILFPVFAQATRAAKASNTENLQKIGQAAAAYSQDADGHIPIMINGPYRNLLNVRDGVLSTYAEGRTDAWPLLLLPYLKDRSVYVDPARGDSFHVWDSPAHASIDPGYAAMGATYRNQSRMPMFGVNYLFLSPMVTPASKMSNATPSDFLVGESHSFSEAQDPANTVFYVPSQRGRVPVDETDKIGTLEITRGFMGVNAPGLWVALGASADSRYTILETGTNCSGDWCGDVDPVTPGKQTGENFFYKDSGGGNNVMFLDYHISYTKAPALAAGTDYLAATPIDGGSGNFLGGAYVTDKAHYLWNLNENFYGA